MSADVKTCICVQNGLLGTLMGAAGVKVDSTDDRRRVTVDGVTFETHGKTFTREPSSALSQNTHVSHNQQRQSVDVALANFAPQVH